MDQIVPSEIRQLCIVHPPIMTQSHGQPQPVNSKHNTTPTITLGISANIRSRLEHTRGICMTTSTTWRSPIDLTFHLEACQYVVRIAKVFLAPNLQPATIDYTLSDLGKVLLTCNIRLHLPHALVGLGPSTMASLFFMMMGTVTWHDIASFSKIWSSA